MIRTKLAAIAFALSAFAVAGAATLTGLSWTTVAGKPALRLAISGHRRARLEVRRHGRLLRIELRRTALGTRVRDLAGSGTIKGVYPYLADHGHGVYVDVLLTKAGRMRLVPVSYGYQAVLAGVTRTPVVKAVAPAVPAARPAAVQATPASGPNILKKLSYFAFPGNRIELHLMTARRPQAPSAFVLTKPAMVVLDIPNTAIAPSVGELKVGAGDVRNVAAVQADGMTRVVIRLVSPAAYRAYVRPHAIDVIIASPNTHIAQAAVATPKVPVLPPGPNHRPRYRLRAITFHRGRDGAGKVQVKLSSSNVAVSVHNSGHRIILTFHDTAVPKAEQRRLVVTDFATPIDTIRTFQDGRSARMILHAYGHYTQMGYQAQRTFLMRVTPVSRRAYRVLERKKNKYASRKISLNFQHIGVRAALQVLANFSGLNFVTSSAVHGTLTLDLHDVPWKQALHLILRIKNLGMERKGNIILVAPAAVMAKEREARLKAYAQASKLEPLETVLIRLNYAKASAIATLLKSTRTVGSTGSTMPFSSVSYSKQTTESTSLLSKRGQVTVDKRTNSLIIQDTPQRIRAIRRLIAKLDRPVRQVLIEARLVEANDGFNKSLGAQLGLNYAYSTPSTSVSTCPAAQCAGSGLSSAPGMPSSTAGTLSSTSIGAFNVNLPSVGVGSSLPATFALTVAKLANNNLLNLELSALQAENKGKIISSPRLITANNRKADIKQGEEQFFNLGFGQSMLQQAVLGLSVTPQITPDNRIIMTVKITDNSFANAVAGTLDEKSLKTQVLVNNGQTVVIGGIYQNSRLRTVTKVPFLGNLPVLGYLFRNTLVNNTRSELLIFLTPRILAPSLSLQSG